MLSMSLMAPSLVPARQCQGTFQPQCLSFQLPPENLKAVGEPLPWPPPFHILRLNDNVEMEVQAIELI